MSFCLVKGEAATYLDSRLGDFRRVVVVGSEYMDIDKLHRLQLALSSGEKTFILSAFVDAADAEAVINGKGMVEFTYADWEHLFRLKVNRSKFRMIRIIAMREGAVAETAEGFRTSRIVLSGIDPARFLAHDLTCEILDIHWYRLPTSLRADGGNPPLIEAFVKCNRLPQPVEGNEIAHQLEKRIGSPDITVSFRTDSWFIEDFRYPVWLPFAGDPVPPTYDEYKARGELVCFRKDSAFVCR